MQTLHSRSLVACLLVPVLAVVAGCWNDGPKTVAVKGTVTYKNQPVPAGVIFFDPDASKGHDGPQGYATIKNGQFDTAETGKGVVPGPHLVRLHGFDGVPGQELPMGKLLFPEYSRAVELTGEPATCNLVVTLPGQPPLK